MLRNTHVLEGYQLKGKKWYLSSYNSHPCELKPTHAIAEADGKVQFSASSTW